MHFLPFFSRVQITFASGWDRKDIRKIYEDIRKEIQDLMEQKYNIELKRNTRLDRNELQEDNQDEQPRCLIRSPSPSQAPSPLR